MRTTDPEAGECQKLLAVMTRSLDSVPLKSRLSADIGSERARNCYRELLTNTLQCAKNFETTVFVEGPILDTTWLLGSRSKAQIEGDLGQRMLACFEDGARVLVGGDSPLMSVTYIEDAFSALLTHDLVLGPTEDGGYVLIGMNKPEPRLFDNVPWSTGIVLSETMNIARSLDLRVKRLDLVWDVDRHTDYVRWLQLKKEYS